MSNDNARSQVRVLGIDLAKSTFQLHGVDESGATVLRKTLSGQRLKRQMVNLPACLVAMEACGSAHYWARTFRDYGHEVRLTAPQFVKPFVKSNKNDTVDAEAVCEAVQRPNMRFVAVKETAQQDTQSLHRIRSLAVANRTAQVNQIRGLLLEYGVKIPQGRHQVRSRIPEILQDAHNGLNPLFRELLHGLYEELVRLDERIGEYDHRIEQLAEQDTRAKALMSIPGIGPKGATALLAGVGDVGVFSNGREMAAWLGLVPRQYSTGGKPRLLGISKRGDVYLRTLLVHGARAAIRVAGKKTDRQSLWVLNLAQRRGRNVAAVALANKMARIAWDVLKNGEHYTVDVACAHAQAV